MNYTKQFNIDWITICIYLLITCFGWLSIYSSSYQPEYSLLNLTFNMIAGKQLFFIILSTLIVVLIILIDIKIITRLGYIIYLICVLSLILVLFFGKEVGGAKAWFDFGVFGLQPAEFAKFGAILVIAKFMILPFNLVALLITFFNALSVVNQISFGLCSTQPSFGKYCLNSN